ncbi:MAG: phosphate ABC transporter substrate-binding/OmpA family protein [Pseudomonadota bacterium]
MTSTDSSFFLTGDLLDFSENSFKLRTSIGPINIDASRVICEGEECPAFDPQDADLSVVLDNSLGQSLPSNALTNYAAFLGLSEYRTYSSPQKDQFLEFKSSGPGDEATVLSATTLDVGAPFDTASNSADVLISARSDDALPAIDGLNQDVVALDSRMIAVHPQNPVSNLSLEALRDIYQGTITNWSVFGGEDQAIRIVAQPGDHALLDLPSSMAQRLKSDLTARDDVAGRIENDPAAIGLVSLMSAADIKPVNLVNQCGMTVEPDIFAAKAGEYPLQQRIYYYGIEGSDDPTQVRFRSFLASAEADTMLDTAGLLRFQIVSQSRDAYFDRLQSAQSNTQDRRRVEQFRQTFKRFGDYERLSTTFRFPTGSSSLDEHGLAELNRLIDYLDAQPEGTRVLFVGYTDNVGTWRNNLNLSKQRANSIAGTVRLTAGERLGDVPFRTIGFGEQLHITCTTGEANRSKNRRVEVWIERPAVDRQIASNNE